MLSRIFEDNVDTHVRKQRRSRLDENDNRSSGESASSSRLIYDRGDGSSIDIVARKKSSFVSGREPSPKNRRVKIKTRKRQKKNHSSSCPYKRGTALAVKSTGEGTFRVHKIYGDGNCMFRAVSYVLWGNEDQHGALRTVVTNYIKNHWREYAGFVSAEWNITSPEEYKNFMITEGVFATELECTVATKLHKMNLSIYREINESGEIERVFHNRLNGSYETARLLFSGRPDSGHYDVLFRQNS